MLRISFILGYALLTALLITFIAVKTIAVVGAGGLGEIASDLDQQLSHPTFLVGLAAFVGVFIVVWITILSVLAKNAPEWERKWVKTLVIGCSFMLVFILALGILAACALYLEGFPKTVAEKMAGLISSPVIMELSFFSMGFVLLLAFNVFRRIREGDEFVDLETVENRDPSPASSSDKDATSHPETPQPLNRNR